VGGGIFKDSVCGVYGRVFGRVFFSVCSLNGVICKSFSEFVLGCYRWVLCLYFVCIL